MSLAGCAAMVSAKICTAGGGSRSAVWEALALLRSEVLAASGIDETSLFRFGQRDPVDIERRQGAG